MEPFHAIGEPLGVLFDPILEHIRTVPHGPQVAIDAAHHDLTTVAELAGDCEGRDRRAAIETLQPHGAVGVPECFRANLARLPTARPAGAGVSDACCIPSPCQQRDS